VAKEVERMAVVVTTGGKATVGAEAAVVKVVCPSP